MKKGCKGNDNIGRKKCRDLFLVEKYHGVKVLMLHNMITLKVTKRMWRTVYIYVETASLFLYFLSWHW